MAHRDAREVGTLLAAGAIAGVARFVGLAILARMFGPAPMGDYALQFATLAAVAAIAGFGLEGAVLLGDHREGSAAWWANLGAAILVALVGSFVLVQAGSAKGWGFRSGDEWTIWAYVLSTSAGAGTVKWLLRQRRFGWIAATQSLDAIGVPAAQLVAIRWVGKQDALLVGLGLASGLSLLVNVVLTLASGLTLGAARDAVRIAWANRNLAVFSVPITFVRRWRDQISIEVLSGTQGAPSVGVFLAVQRITMGVSSLALNAVGTVATGDMARLAGHTGLVEAMLARRMGGALRWMVAAAVPVAAYPEFVVRVALGNRWLAGIPLVPWYAWGSVVLVTLSWTQSGMVIARRQHWALAIEIAGFTLTYTVVSFGSMRQASLAEFTAWFLATVAAATIARAIAGCHAMGVRLSAVSRLLLPETTFLGAGILLATVAWFLPPPAWSVGATLAASVGTAVWLEQRARTLSEPG